MSSKLSFWAPTAICLALISTSANSAPNIAVTAAPNMAVTGLALIRPSVADLGATSTASDAAVAPASDDSAPELTVQLGKDAEKQSAKAKNSRKGRTKWEQPIYASTPDTGLTDAQLDRAGRIAREALSYRGAPYVWGGDGRGGVFDCSGFTQYLYAKKGVRLPHSAKMQFGIGQPIDRPDLKTGDLVFFNTERGPLTHVGMYIGDSHFIHAANPRRGVTTSSLDDPYYSRRYAGARRYSG